MDLTTKNQKIQEIKEKCKRIISEEAAKEGIKLNIEPITIVEYYNTDVFKQKTKLQKISKKYSLRKVGGFFDSREQKILVFVDRMGQYEKIDSSNKFAAVLFATYHEYRHQLQWLGKGITPSEEFIIEIENTIHTFNHSDYKHRHDQYYKEIDANLYGVNKTKEYFKQNDPNEYKGISDYLEKTYENRTKHHKRNYDFSKTFTKFYYLCRLKRLDMNKLKIKGIDIFINSANKFRKVSEIKKLHQKSNLDKSILYGVIGSRAFMEQLDITILTDEEKEFMTNNLNEILLIESKKIEANNKFFELRKIQVSEYLKSCKGILSKINYICQELPNIKYTILLQQNINSSKKNINRLKKVKEQLV